MYYILISPHVLSKLPTPAYPPLSSTLIGAPGGPGRQRRMISKRHSRVLLAVCILGVIVLYFRVPQLLFGRWALPYYEKHRNHEDNLPHYNTDAPYPNGQHAKYILFGSHQRGAYIVRHLYVWHSRAKALAGVMLYKR